jgi:hypothetical protein
MNSQSRYKRKAYQGELLSNERANPIECLIHSSKSLLRASGLQIPHSCPSFGNAVQSAVQSEHNPTRIVMGAGWAAIMVSANEAMASPHLAATCRVRSHDCQMLSLTRYHRLCSPIPLVVFTSFCAFNHVECINESRLVGKIMGRLMLDFT